MSFDCPADIQQSISDYVARGTYQSEAEVLRAAIHLLDQRQDDLASIERGLADAAQGKVRPAKESNEEFKRAQNIPSVE